MIVYSINLWLATGLLFLSFSGICLAGAWLRARRGDLAGDGGAEGAILSATLALLGLLIGFTFSMALGRYDARRTLVVTEANAIGTAWLRAGLAGEQTGPALQAAITRYTDVRLRLPHRDTAAAVDAATDRAQVGLWAQMRGAVRDTPPPIAATIITATNEMFDAASARKAERAARIPGRVFEILILYAVLSAGIVGYVLGAGRRHIVLTSILFLLLSLALVLIVDLDRPWSGGVTVSQQPMVDARASMGR